MNDIDKIVQDMMNTLYPFHYVVEIKCTKCGKIFNYTQVLNSNEVDIHVYDAYMMLQETCDFCGGLVRVFVVPIEYEFKDGITMVLRKKYGE